MTLRMKFVLITFSLGGSVALAQQGAASNVPGRQSPAQQVVVLRNARVIDGTGAAPREHVSLLLRNGKIEQIGGGEMAAPAGAQVRDLTGKTVMPGLISAHSHLGLLVDDAESSAAGYTRENVTAQLKQYERYGVTAILSLGLNRDLVFVLRDEQQAGRLGGASIFTAGRGIGVPEGAPPLPAAADQIYRPATEKEARRAVDEMAAQRVDIIKIWVDKLHGKSPEMTPEIYKAVIDEAHKRHVRVAAHEYALEDAKQLVADGVDVLAHSVRDQVVDDAFVRAMKQHRVWYVPTFTVDESAYIYADDPAFMKTTFFQQAAGPKLLAKFSAPGYGEKIGQDPQTAQHKKDFDVGQQNLKKLFDAGVSVGFGTDSGALPGRIPGFAEHHELALMVKAGLTPLQTITAATGGNAKLLHATDRGTIEVGKRADLLVLDADPLVDIGNTQRIFAVYHDGHNIVDLPSLVK
ncbi:amidohydrolase family protein [Tunturiibacter empetritectus]|uniref:Imidazolonepropionase-like amidohydrolase n=1 Tax=Tunturiibacter lichenicola TaxID=2051959 RepID=A0A852VL64_9BACT|nr:amidohydrolase family protein [Edaphobacter lichenicola]NYF90855.1 imidazolonepropionase-like amidohydrolase [Edaphobacter lichenicola]